MPRAAKVLKAIAGLLCAIMFALPIAGIIQHAVAMDQAEKAFQIQQRKHQQEMDKLLKEYNHVRSQR